MHYEPTLIFNVGRDVGAYLVASAVLTINPTRKVENQITSLGNGYFMVATRHLDQAALHRITLLTGTENNETVVFVTQDGEALRTYTKYLHLMDLGRTGHYLGYVFQTKTKPNQPHFTLPSGNYLIISKEQPKGAIRRVI